MYVCVQLLFMLIFLRVSPVDRIRAHGVVVGEVFLCSGQSNMEKSVNYIINASAEIADADLIQTPFRLFQVPSTPPGPKGPWHTPSRDLAGNCLVCEDPPQVGIHMQTLLLFRR